MNLQKPFYPVLFQGSKEVSIEKAIERDLLPITLPRPLLTSTGVISEGKTRITEVRRETTDDE